MFAHGRRVTLQIKAPAGPDDHAQIFSGLDKVLPSTSNGFTRPAWFTATPSSGAAQVS